MDLTPESDITTELGDAIRTARQERGLSQEELAELVGVHRTYLSALEQGHRTLRLERLIAILDTLGLTLSIQPKSARTSAESADRHRAP